MRRRAALFLLPLLLTACGGGGGSDSSPQPLERIFSADADENTLSFAVASDGTPVIGNYNLSNRTLNLASPTGSLGQYVIPGMTQAPVGLSGDFILTYVKEGNGPSTVYVLDRRTGESRSVAGKELLAQDGNRVVWRTGSEYEVEDLGTGERTPLSIGAEGTVRALAGDRLLVAKVKEDEHYSQTTYSYSIYTIGGTKIANLTTPQGYYVGTPRSINAAGEAVGIAHTVPLDAPAEVLDYRAVRWSASGAPTVLNTKILLKPSGIADDGSIVAQDLNGGGYLYRGKAQLNLRLGSPNSELTLDRSGFLFRNDHDRYALTAYHLR